MYLIFLLLRVSLWVNIVKMKCSRCDKELNEESYSTYEVLASDFTDAGKDIILCKKCYSQFRTWLKK